MINLNTLKKNLTICPICKQHLSYEDTSLNKNVFAPGYVTYIFKCSNNEFEFSILNANIDTVIIDWYDKPFYYKKNVTNEILIEKVVGLCYLYSGIELANKIENLLNITLVFG